MTGVRGGWVRTCTRGMCVRVFVRPFVYKPEHTRVYVEREHTYQLSDFVCLGVW